MCVCVCVPASGWMFAEPFMFIAWCLVRVRLHILIKLRGWVAQLAGEDRVGDKMTGHLFHSRCALMSHGCFYFLYFCCTRCVPWAWAGFNTQHSIPEIHRRFCLIFLQSAFRPMHVHTGGAEEKKKVPFSGASCPRSTILFANNIMGSWLPWHYLSHVRPSFLLCFTPPRGDSASGTTFTRRFINTKSKKHALLSISLLLSPVMMYFTWQPRWNLLHPGDGTEGGKMEFHLLNANPIFNYTKKKTLTHAA